MKTIFSVTLIACAVTLASPVRADDFVTCESTGSKRTFCDVRSIRDSSVDLDRQLSKSLCIEGSSWGTDSRGIWVQDGCRADFRVSRRYGSNDSRYDPLDREREDLALERERLDIEKERLALERSKVAAPAAAQPAHDSCPPEMRPGRCTDKQRAHGCKDMRTAGGLGCMSN